MRKTTAFALFAFIFMLGQQAFSQLSGSYTIGTNNSDYTSISAAITDLATNGISADVVFNIKDGVYNERLILENTITGTENYSVTFQSELLDSSKVTLKHLAESRHEHLIELTLAKNLIFRHLTFEIDGNYTCKVVKLNHGIENLEISNCYFNLKNGNNNGIDLAQPLSDENASKNITLKSNTFNYGYAAISFEGGYYGVVTSVTISNNIFINQRSKAIHLSSVENIHVQNNEITSITSTYNDVSAYGVGLKYCKDFEISFNKIYTTYSAAISLDNCTNEADLKKSIYNNFGSTKIKSMTGKVIVLNNCTYVDVIFNSFNLIGAATGYSNQTALFTGNTNLNIANNIFYNDEYHAINLDSNTGILTCNNNFIYAPAEKFVRYNGATLTSLSEWQTSTNLDLNSVTGNLTFTSDSDLHAKSSLLDSMAMVWSGIDTDIDGETRNTTKPDIGANEFEITNTTPEIADQTFSLNENPALNFEIGTIIATDEDSDQTLTFSIINGNANNGFALDSISGILKVANTEYFNFEEVSSTILTVKVEDDAEVSLSNTAEITINILDINEAPTVNDTIFYVYENSAVGDTVGFLKAFDQDANQELIYTITDGNVVSSFDIDFQTGAILVNRNDISYEDFTNYELSIMVGDNADVSLDATAMVSIIINNVNEPTYIDDQTFNIDENPLNGSEIGYVIPSDDDFPYQYTFNNPMKIISGNDQGTFSIDSLFGTIYVADSTLIDYEINTSLEIKIVITDGEFFDTATVVFNINDVTETSINTPYLNNIYLYPNPSNGKIKVLNITDNCLIEVFSAAGKLLLTTHKSEFVIDYYKGMAIVKVTKNENQIIKKIIIE